MASSGGCLLLVLLTAASLLELAVSSNSIVCGSEHTLAAHGVYTLSNCDHATSGETTLRLKPADGSRICPTNVSLLISSGSTLPSITLLDCDIVADPSADLWVSIHVTHVRVLPSSPVPWRFLRIDLVQTRNIQLVISNCTLYASESGSEGVLTESPIFFVTTAQAENVIVRIEDSHLTSVATKPSAMFALRLNPTTLGASGMTSAVSSNVSFTAIRSTLNVQLHCMTLSSYCGSYTAGVFGAMFAVGFVSVTVRNELILEDLNITVELSSIEARAFPPPPSAATARGFLYASMAVNIDSNAVFPIHRGVLQRAHIHMLSSSIESAGNQRGSGVHIGELFSFTDSTVVLEGVTQRSVCASDRLEDGASGRLAALVAMRTAFQQNISCAIRACSAYISMFASVNDHTPLNSSSLLMVAVAYYELFAEAHNCTLVIENSELVGDVRNGTIPYTQGNMFGAVLHIMAVSGVVVDKRKEVTNIRYVVRNSTIRGLLGGWRVSALTEQTGGVVSASLSWCYLNTNVSDSFIEITGASSLQLVEFDAPPSSSMTVTDRLLVYRMVAPCVMSDAIAAFLVEFRAEIVFIVLPDDATLPVVHDGNNIRITGNSWVAVPDTFVFGPVSDAGAAFDGLVAGIVLAPSCSRSVVVVETFSSTQWSPFVPLACFVGCALHGSVMTVASVPQNARLILLSLDGSAMLENTTVHVNRVSFCGSTKEWVVGRDAPLALCFATPRITNLASAPRVVFGARTSVVLSNSAVRGPYIAAGVFDPESVEWSLMGSEQRLWPSLTLGCNVVTVGDNDCWEGGPDLEAMMRGMQVPADVGAAVPRQLISIPSRVYFQGRDDVELLCRGFMHTASRSPTLPILTAPSHNPAVTPAVLRSATVAYASVALMSSVAGGGALASASAIPALQSALTARRYRAWCDVVTQQQSSGGAPPPPVPIGTDPLDNPTSLALGESSSGLRNAAGGAVGNTLLVVGLGCVTAAAALVRKQVASHNVTKRQREKGGAASTQRTLWEYVAAVMESVLPFVSLPGSLLPPYAVLVQPTTTAALFLTIGSDGDAAGMVVLGVLILLCWIALPVWYLYRVLGAVPSTVAARPAPRHLSPTRTHDRRAGFIRAGLLRLLTPQHVWALTPSTTLFAQHGSAAARSTERAAGEMFIERYSPTFDCYVARRHWYFSVESSAAIVSGALCACAATDPCAHVEWLPWCLLGSNTALLLMIVALRPYSVRLDVFGSVSAVVMSMLMELLTILGAPDSWAGYVALAAVATQLLPLLATVSVLVLEGRLPGRQFLRSAGHQPPGCSSTDRDPHMHWTPRPHPPVGSCSRMLPAPPFPPHARMVNRAKTPKQAEVLQQLIRAICEHH